MNERDELINELAERLAAVEGERKAFQAQFDAAKAPIDKRKKEDEAWEMAQDRMAHITGQLHGLRPHFARECEKVMPPIWTAAKRYFAEAADSAGMDGDRRTIFDQASGKLHNLLLVPGDLVKEITAIRQEVGDKLASLERARATAAIPVQTGVRKAQPVTARTLELYAASIGTSYDSGLAAEIEME